MMNKEFLKALGIIILTPTAFLLAWAVGVNLREGEWIRSIEFLILTVAAAWSWFWVRDMEENKNG